MNGAGLTPGSVAGSGASGGDKIMGAEVGWFAESDRGGFGEVVLGGWIRGEDVEAFSEDPFEMV